MVPLVSTHQVTAAGHSSRCSNLNDLQAAKCPWFRIRGFPGGASGKELARRCRRHESLGSIPKSGRSPGVGESRG